MRIYKKHPFSAPNSVRVNELATQCERIEKTIEDLQVIRQRINDGTMTEELYDFINLDGCLDNVLLGLPRPSDETACEALAFTQTTAIDAAMEDLVSKWKTVVSNMWSALREFLLDWLDVNRYTRIQLQRERSAFTVNPGTYGNSRSFSMTTSRVYHKPYWEEMLGGCETLNKVISELPRNGGDLSKWIESNLVRIQTSIKPFGHSVSQPGPNLVEGSPKYDRNTTTLDAARWRFNLLGQDMDRCIKCLGDEVQYRNMFNTLEDLFLHATFEQKIQLNFVRRLVMLGKADIFVVARGLRAVLRAARSTASNAK